MNRLTLAALSLGVCAAFGALAIADDAKQEPPKRAEMDKPVKNFKAKDIMRDLKENEKPEAAVTPLLLPDPLKKDAEVKEAKAEPKKADAQYVWVRGFCKEYRASLPEFPDFP